VSLDDTELYDTADAFGVDLDQVRRDHVISHVLAAISTHARDTFLFTGGTMLSRTWLRDVRLSEDVDLMVYETRSVAGARLADLVRSEIEPLFGRVEWDKDPATAGDAESIFASVGDDVTIKFQLVDTIGRAPWPRERVAIHQRYSDAPPAELLIPTREAVVAMKLTAWIDRRASRDLYDLMAMAERGMITRDAFATYGKYGQTTRPLAVRYFHNPPAEDRWVEHLGHQCRLAVTAAAAIARVGQALADIGALDGEYPGTEDTPAWLSAPESRRARKGATPT
jgi:predicted nucleotidyltransferase component of viral defense system